ncbi:hypothetical protein C482_05596 [Natrialba chahannaoensis JCM 10990]|uniref:Uncharacterized protein n=1 Tax=Natrialba chahannaoensis JCM 10990 TaxID=1227492 RepID=M0AUR0_9EURY|nr:hypothetical protein [Natrialba chahannaoensis]ELZ02047.1 hypothetical protein C482_05596 [Natrialba chahannaoensis JCM 10990]
MSRSYKGTPLDGTVQNITERPDLKKQAEQVEYATEPEPVGGERTEGVPEIGDDQDVERPNVDGQTLSRYRRSGGLGTRLAELAVRHSNCEDLDHYAEALLEEVSN